jgi:putative transposase
MSMEQSPGAGKRFPLTLVCAVWRVARSSLYAASGATSTPHATGPRGPRPPVTDTNLLAAIRRLIAASSIHGESYRKTWARLRYGEQTLLASKRRMLQLMCTHHPLAPTRDGTPHGPQAHDGTITNGVRRRAADNVRRGWSDVKT